MHPACPNKKQNHLQNSFLRRAQFWVRKTFSKPASLKRASLVALAGHGDGHILTVTVALLLAILTGRSDLCIAGVFGAGKTRSLAVLLIALSCELDDFSAVIYTKENVAAKALADQISNLSPLTLTKFGRLLGRIEEGKGEAYATKINVRCNDRNRIIATKRILIATGGLPQRDVHALLHFQPMLSRVWIAFIDQSQQYGNYHEIAALAAIQQPALIVFVGDHRQTSGGLSKGRAAAANRQKLLLRPLGLRALNRPGDYLPPARLACLVGLLWPDASQDSDSDIARLLQLGKALTPECGPELQHRAAALIGAPFRPRDTQSD